jgi:hypothetical protein
MKTAQMELLTQVAEVVGLLQAHCFIKVVMAVQELLFFATQEHK